MARRDLEERPTLAGLAWVAGLIAVAFAVWLVARAQHPAPLPAPALAPPATAGAGVTSAASGPESTVTPAATTAADEVTHEERRALEDVLRRKGTGQTR